VIHTSNATPLLALDAAVIDTETTGLDARTARVVEIGAIHVTAGRIITDTLFCRRVNPGEPIPPVAAAVHGIDDAAVAGAPGFREVWTQLADHLGGRVVIGHSVGFDLAVLRRECERAGIAFRPPRVLDTRLLAEIAAPRLADYGLEDLGAWLKVALTGRHSAGGDAVIAARIFLALLPHLRERGIRTFGEATQACRRLTDVLEDQYRAGWDEPIAAAADGVGSLARIDSYPYRHRISDIMRVPAVVVGAQTPIGDALALLMRERISSCYVRRRVPAAGGDHTGTAEPGTDAGAIGADAAAIGQADAGIVTERDLLRAVAEHGAGALALPVERCMSAPLATVPADAFIYRAIGRMNRLRVRHLGVVDDAGTVVGALSARDLLRLRASEAVSLGDEIDAAADAPDLAAAWARLPHVAASLIAEGVPARGVAAVLSSELGALTRQAAVIAERRLRAEGRGEPPCPYALVVLGSAGRGESLLAMDQDNAIVFAEGAADSPADRWFARLGEHVADILHDVGVDYCRGGVMAKTPQWRGSLRTWRERIAAWIGRSSPGDLLSVDIFFDLLPVHGDGGLAAQLRQEAFDAARGQFAFAKLLVETAGPVDPGLNLFGALRTKAGRIDLKKAGLFGIVAAARALAICHHVTAHSTPQRLAGLKALALGSAEDLDQLGEAQDVLLDLILRQQIEDIGRGLPASNAVVVKGLSRRDRDALRSALRTVGSLASLPQDLLFPR
jgi:CBS domain-containing protein